MKRMKALLGVVLVIAMVLSLSMVAFADTEEKIVIRDAKPDTYDYAFYKIFTAEIDSNDSTKVVYKVVSAWENDVKAFSQLKVDETTKVVTKLENYSASDFAEYLATKLEGKTADLAKNDTTHYVADTEKDTVTATFANAPGYYFITYGQTGSTTGAEPYALTTVLPDQTSTIQNKHDMPFDKDVYDAAGNPINEEGVKVGDILTYKITGAAPALNENTDSFYYKVVDTLSKGLKYAGGLSVKLKTAADDPTTANVDETAWVDLITVTGDADHPALVRETDLARDIDTQHKYQLNDNSTGTAEDDPYTFVVNIDFTKIANNSYLTGADTIEITYNAVVTSDALVHVIDNQADLYYTRDGHTEVRHAETRNYVVELIIDKFETGNNAQKLAGAQFVLYKEVPQVGTAAVADDPTTPDDESQPASADYVAAHKEYFKYTAATGTPGQAGYVASKAEWVLAQGDATTYTTDASGAASIVGLPDGTFYLLETAAPTGYVILDTPIEVVIDGSKALDNNLVVENNPDKTENNQALALTTFANVANTPGSVLPSTGGRGTTMLYMAGLGMMLAAGAFLIFRRRAEAGK